MTDFEATTEAHRGGDLIIGVTDDRHVLGPCLDYQTLRVPSRDGFENKLISLFSAKVGDTSLRFLKVSFPIIGASRSAGSGSSPRVSPSS